MALILLRHTKPAGGEGRCYSRLDLPCGPDFPAEATSVLRDLPSVATVATSPAARCRRLAAVIAEAGGLPLHTDPRLAEIDFGRWEGLPWDAVPRAELDAWAADVTGARPHGGESVAMFTARVGAALADWRRAAGPVLLVAHAGTARAARALAGDPDPWSFRLAHGAWVEV